MINISYCNKFNSKLINKYKLFKKYYYYVNAQYLLSIFVGIFGDGIWSNIIGFTFLFERSGS